MNRINREHANCEIDIFGGGISYIVNHRNYVLDDCDLMAFYSSAPYELQKIEDILNIAFKISNEKQKRVSVGYSYVLPLAERKCENISEEIRIVSFHDCVVYDETTDAIQYFTPENLIEMVAVIHDELEHQDGKKLSKKIV